MNLLAATSILQDKNIQKIAKYVGGAIILIILILIVRRMIRKAKEEKAVDEMMNLYEEASQTQTLSYSDIDYKTMADSIQTYISAGMFTMNGGLLGVNQQGIYDVMMRMKTDADIYKLISCYGVREYKKPGHFYIGGRPSAGLPSTLLDVLKKGEIREINSILEENGLQYRF